MAKKKTAGKRYFGKALTDDPDDAPELLNDFFRHGELRHGDRLVRRGRPPLRKRRAGVRPITDGRDLAEPSPGIFGLNLVYILWLYCSAAQLRAA
jgi:hypothetical protein